MRRLLSAARPVLFDSLGVVVFALLAALHLDVIFATLAAASVAVGLVAWERLRGRPVPALQWLSLGLVLVPAGATLLTHDPRFMMAKPTIIYTLAGLAMLQPGWMQRYLADYPALWNEAVINRFGFIWAGLMFATSVANLVVAVLFTPWWPTFIAAFPLGSKFVLFVVQYVTLRSIARRKMQAARAVT